MFYQALPSLHQQLLNHFLHYFKMFFLNKFYTLARNIFVLIGVFFSILWLGKISAKKEEKEKEENENLRMQNKILTYERKVEKLDRDAISRVLRQREDIH